MKRIFSLILILLLTQSVAFADNYAITEGAGRTVGADEISSVIYPRIKLIFGNDGANSGDASTTNPFPMTDVPSTATGWSPFKKISTADTNATNVKASAGVLGGWAFSNINASARYLKLYNKATSPSVGSDTPVMTVLIPGNASGILANVEFNKGVLFSLGLSFAITTGVADGDTGAVAANELVINLLYK